MIPKRVEQLLVQFISLMIIAQLEELKARSFHKPASSTPRKQQLFRHSTFASEPERKWRTINKSLTNRYNRAQQINHRQTLKVGEQMRSLPNSHKSLQIELDRLHLTPRFQIKRKYLTFAESPNQQKGYSNQRRFYSMQHKQDKTIQNNSVIFVREQIAAKKGHRERDFIGTYFIPKNINPYYRKLGQLSVKRSSRRSYIVPELHVQANFQNKKQPSATEEASSVRRPKKEEKKPKKEARSWEKKQEEFFRPWSGREEEL